MNSILKLSRRDRYRVILAGAVTSLLTFMLLVLTGGVGI